MLTQRELDDIKGWAIEAAGLNEELVAVRRKSELVLSESLGLQAREEQILVRLYEIERDIVRTAVPRSNAEHAARIKYPAYEADGNRGTVEATPPSTGPDRNKKR